MLNGVADSNHRDTHNRQKLFNERELSLRPYYKVWLPTTKYPVRTTKHYKVGTTQYYSVLESISPFYKVSLSTTKTTTKYWGTLYYSVLQIVLRTTK